MSTRDRDEFECEYDWYDQSRQRCLPTEALYEEFQVADVLDRVVDQIEEHIAFEDNPRKGIVSLIHSILLQIISAVIHTCYDPHHAFCYICQHKWCGGQTLVDTKPPERENYLYWAKTHRNKKTKRNTRHTTTNSNTNLHHRRVRNRALHPCGQKFGDDDVVATVDRLLERRRLYSCYLCPRVFHEICIHTHFHQFYEKGLEYTSKYSRLCHYCKLYPATFSNWLAQRGREGCAWRKEHIRKEHQFVLAFGPSPRTDEEKERLLEQARQCVEHDQMDNKQDTEVSASSSSQDPSASASDSACDSDGNSSTSDNMECEEGCTCDHCKGDLGEDTLGTSWYVCTDCNQFQCACEENEFVF